MSTPAQKHIPVRMCVVCRDKAGKRTLTRVVRTEQGLQIDPSGKLNGRGAYLCDRVSCWDTAVKTDLLAKALRMSLTEEDRERLRRARA
ncbi:MAG TPA: YlxR family protein [Phototrophicaceae bacterium]|nr:YlxR family protein [Phototrophicaceae bacterium]